MNALYYAQRSSAALIVSEATQVSQQGQGYAWTPGIHSLDQVEGWRLVAEAVHKAGGLIFMQLWHVGRISHPSLQPDGMLPVAPSSIKPKGMAFIENESGEGELVPFVTPRALETEEIPYIVKQYCVEPRMRWRPASTALRFTQQTAIFLTSSQFRHQQACRCVRRLRRKPHEASLEVAEAVSASGALIAWVRFSRWVRSTTYATRTRKKPSAALRKSSTSMG